MSSEIVKVETDSGTVDLSGDIIRKTLCDNKNVTDREVALFIGLCKAQHLNPFIKEAHIIKYGDNPATMVVGKDVFTKRAQKNPKFKGMQAGISFNSNGKLGRREGSMLLPGEEILGGWCKVYVDGYQEPVYDEVSFDEYAGRKKNGELNQQWQSKPGTMIRKVAVVHALREAFPDDLAGLYDASEMGVETPSDAPQSPSDSVQTSEEQPVEMEAEFVEDIPETKQTIRETWKVIGSLKETALSLGIEEGTITKWMSEIVKTDDGASKPYSDYTASDVLMVRDYINTLIRDAEATKVTDDGEYVDAEIIDDENLEPYKEDVLF